MKTGSRASDLKDLLEIEVKERAGAVMVKGEVESALKAPLRSASLQARGQQLYCIKVQCQSLVLTSSCKGEETVNVGVTGAESVEWRWTGNGVQVVSLEQLEFDSDPSSPNSGRLFFSSRLVALVPDW